MPPNRIRHLAGLGVPRPIETAARATPGKLNGADTVIVRSWAEPDARACRLCPAGQCMARPTLMTCRGPGEVYVCTVVAPGVVGLRDAPLYSPPAV